MRRYLDFIGNIGLDIHTMLVAGFVGLLGYQAIIFAFFTKTFAVVEGLHPLKSRLNRIGQRLDFVEHDPAPSRADVIDRLRRGEITAQEALAGLERRT